MASCDSLLVDDLATLSELTERTLLEHLRRRYNEGVIYVSRFLFTLQVDVCDCEFHSFDS